MREARHQSLTDTQQWHALCSPYSEPLKGRVARSVEEKPSRMNTEPQQHPGQQTGKAQPEGPAEGLSPEEAARRLAQYGPNEVPERRPNRLLALAHEFWAPVPWMLEAAIVLTLVLGKYADAIIISFLLAFNALVSFLQQGRAQNALALLRQRLPVNARVLRGGQWQVLPASVLVPGDIVHVRAGDIVPADLRLLDGSVQVDQSALTGESAPREAAAQATIYSASTVQRGEATGEVSATGARTYFGRTTQLVQEARAASHLQSIVFSIVRYLIAIDVLLGIVILAYAIVIGAPLADVIPFALILLIASVPVALPATFSVAEALGSLEMSRTGVLVTHLPAIEEAASMDVLCLDKTGTITPNRLTVGSLRALPPYTDDQLLEFGAIASDAAGQDPIDLAILQVQEARAARPRYRRLSFTPFDPSTKRTEAMIERDGERWRIIKGAPKVIAQLSESSPSDLAADVNALAEQGYRVLAVAGGPVDHLQFVGLIGLLDRPRPDSAQLITELRSLGIRLIMVTGDTAPTARAIAREVGMGEETCSRERMRGQGWQGAAQCDIFAGVFPQDKYDLVRSLQGADHTVGMTGDGVNDAPALKQAEVGIAVSGATDVAKAAASIVLVDPGLLDIVAAVKESRRIFQRMLTYTLNKIIKTIQVALFLSLGFLLTRTFLTTPFLIVLLLFANDFVTMSLATDNVSYSSQPDRWRIASLVAAAVPLGLIVLVESFLALYLAQTVFHLTLPQTQTLVFVMLVFSGQATVYLIRQRRHFWTRRPSVWLAAATSLDLTIVTILATQGILMAAVSLSAVLIILGISVVFLLLMDPIKIQIFARFGLV